jgi:cobyrinic acid a,c-diamide synthase
MQSDLPGDLRLIAEALDLPLIAVLPVCEGPGALHHLPRLPEHIDAVLLDGVKAPEELRRVRRLLRLTGSPPVLGALPELPEIRREVEQSPRSRHLPGELLRELGQHFLHYADLDAIDSLCRSRPFPGPVDASCTCGQADCGRCFRVAYAQDEAFGRYFPDTLEALEALGAELVEFSPLRDEALPENVDLVMIGCGFPDLYAERLASNVSMMAALREHVCKGQRIYTEGGGTAYLARWMLLDGQRITGAGIFPFEAELLGQPVPPRPVSRTLTHDCWLGTKGTTVRGYHSSRWRLHPSLERFECPACSGLLTSHADLLYHHHAVGSLIHLHLGALPEVVSAFAGPHRPSLKRPSFQGLADIF